MRIAFASGKGGTGKTTLVAAFAHLADHRGGLCRAQCAGDRAHQQVTFATSAG
ncbi:MAG: hypothetical protein JRJ84_25715 [Deltaproteobacteria bacterium]|nr:hypothetical protein [Deltaproteobacteria bacterium]